MRQRRKALAYYVTPHGFGHAVRSCEILRSLRRLSPGLDITIVTDLPEWLFEQNIGVKLPVRRVALDIGLHQCDSVRFDLGKSLAALQKLKLDAPGIIERESRLLREQGVSAVVSDIAFLPFAAAEKSAIPAVGVSNFTWDWIYESYEGDDPGWKEIVDWVRGCYSSCSLLLRLPMHGGCSACARTEDVPLVARKSRRDPREVRKILEIPESGRSFLVSFTSLELDGVARKRLERIEDAVFIYKKPLDFPLANGVEMDGSGVAYVDAVAAVDAVITKPGYGIVSDCLANGTPVIYTSRGPFPEYPALVEALEEHLATVYIDSEDFRTGGWEDAMRRIGSLPRRMPDIRIDGADVAAERILGFL